VKAGFLASGAMASVFKALVPFGLVRLLLVLGKMPLYPEQILFRSAVSADDYRQWIAAVCRDFAGAAGQGAALGPAHSRRGTAAQGRPAGTAIR
jgi:hypothetical protein